MLTTLPLILDGSDRTLGPPNVTEATSAVLWGRGPQAILGVLESLVGKVGELDWCLVFTCASRQT